VPVIVTAVPPAVLPVDGDTPVTVGATGAGGDAEPTYVYAPASFALCPSGLTTVTSTLPAFPSLATAVIGVAL
jgi:hypothetical protein